MGRLEFPGADTAGEETPNGIGESLTSIDDTNSGVIRRRPSLVLVSICLSRTLLGSKGLLVIGLVK